MVKTLEITESLFRGLTRLEVRWCHWKSNSSLDDALKGEEDLDLLIHRDDIGQFERQLLSLGFKHALPPSWERTPSVEHFFGLDRPTGRIVHVHAYYELITGGSFLKNYKLPVESMLFENTRSVNGVVVPTKGVEMLMLVVRKMLEWASFPEVVMAVREWPSLKNELRWLHGPQAEDEAMSFADEYFPQIPQDVLRNCIGVIQRGSRVRCLLLGRKLRSALKCFALHSKPKAFLVSTSRLAIVMCNRFMTGRPSPCRLASSGALIAIVGPEASGKTTLVGHIESWLGIHLESTKVHAGKPGPSLLTFIPRIFLPLARALFPTHRTNVSEEDSSNEGGSSTSRRWSLLMALRSVMIAYDQRKELRRAFAKAASGAIVVSDRYPAARLGGTDGPRMDPNAFGRHSVKRTLAMIEQKIYASMPKPDLAIVLELPLELALMRNSDRQKKGKAEPDGFVRHRWQMMQEWDMPQVRLARIDTTRPLEETLLEIKALVWSAIE